MQDPTKSGASSRPAETSLPRPAVSPHRPADVDAPHPLTPPRWLDSPRRTYDLLPCGVAELDPSGIVQFCNPAFELLLGKSHEEIVGRSLWHGVETSGDESTYRSALAAWSSGGIEALAIEIRCRRADGTLVNLCWQGSPRFDASDELVGYLVAAMPQPATAEAARDTVVDAAQLRDIERRANQRATALANSVTRLEREIEQRCAAEEAQARLVAILDTTPDFVGIADASHRVLYINRGGREMYGLAEDEDISQMTLADLTTPQTLVEHIEHRFPIAMHETYWQGETVLHGRNGRRTPVSQVVLAHRDSTGHVAYYSTIARDLSARVADEAALRAQHRRLRDILDGVVTFAALIAKDGTVLEVNRAVVETSGYRREEIIGKHIAETNWWNYSAEARQHINDQIAKAVSGTTAHFSALCQSREGNFMPAQGAFSPVFDAQGNVTEIVGSGVDMTARDEAEEAARQHLNELAHVSRIALLGEMVGGIAHELNQPLTAIANFADVCAAELAERGMAGVANVQKSLIRISEEALRAGAIIRGLRRLVRKTEAQRAPTDLGDLLREVVDLAKADARDRGVQVETHLADGLPFILADRIQIQQVVLNLLSNAFESLAAGQPEQRRVVIQCAAREAGFVEIAVADNGRGFDHHDAERLFDAFYTTKTRGMGLGLSTSRAIIDAHGGCLWAESSAPRGATFRLKLPVDSGESGERLRPRGAFLSGHDSSR
ncbi:MAG: PAS domain S-box protein [Pirellulales bacterium]|nr:PAS domain S-box protein [Pirellulales bacterium]